METEKNGEIILTTAYLPNIQYFVNFLHGKILLEQHEYYVKQTWRNRCKILTTNGTMSLLSVPIKHTGTAAKIKIRDVRIDYSTSWQQLHWRTIRASYSSSPFFEYYVDDFLPFFEKREEFLFDFNLGLIYKLLELTGIKAEILLSEQYFPEYEFDLRTSINLKNPIPTDNLTPYYQVFGKKNGFMQNLSIFDLLCNEGNNSYSVLTRDFNNLFPSNKGDF